MKVISVGSEVNDLRHLFFETIFGDHEGYIGVASLKGKKFNEEFFQYPQEVNQLLEWVNLKYHGRSLYFCPQLLDEPRRKKENVKTCTCVWSDLDECDPNILDPKPSIVIETSPGRHQALWLLDEPADPADAEDASHRIAYKYEAFGADKSGWDLTQLLRIPVTYNTKYGDGSGSLPIVEIKASNDIVYPLTTFQALPSPPGYEFTEIPFPEEIVGLEPGPIFEKYKHRLDPKIIELYQDAPEGDWSASLWRLENLLFECGVERDEVFVVCWNAACNKYKRDKRPPVALWKDVCKADTRLQAHHDEVGNKPPVLLTAEERAIAEKHETFVDRYVEWCKTRGDAAWQYHEAGGFTILSALLSGAVKLKTSFGTIIPNVWYMILADTTLTRKSTAMDMAMDLLREVQGDVILATDGSVEGLMSAISTRPGKPGIFWKDEFSGFLEAITKKDYMAGMAESLTKLYDGKYQKKQLRREIIELKDPVLIMLCGGIRSRTYELLGFEHIVSGFAPRFIFIMAESDMGRYQPLGPMSEEQDETHGEMVQYLADLRDRYITDISMRIGGQEVTTPASWETKLTKEAWDRYNEFEMEMVNYGIASNNPEIVTPMMDRLSKSGLKIALLIAAERQDPQEKGYVDVEVKDILKAISYIDRWRMHSINILENVGKTATEKKVEFVYKFIRASRSGVMRSTLMQNCHLTSREAEWILDTLDQRALISRRKHGRAELVQATDSSPDGKRRRGRPPVTK